MFKHSYSSLSCFETCPNQFKEKYVLKTIKFQQNEAARYGSEGHSAMEEAVKANTLPTGRWEFAAPVIQSIYNAAKDAPIHVEYELGLDENKSPTKFWDGWLRGKLDVFYKPSEDRGTLIDYKFAKHAPAKYNLEMSVFSYLLFKTDNDLEAIKRGLLWMKQDSPGKPTMSIVTRKDNFGEIEDTVLGKIAVVERSLEFDNFPCKPSGLCSWCDARQCKFWKPRK